MTGISDDATQLDRAIDTILGETRGPVAPDDDGLVAAARLLRRSLPCLHPGLRFEEHLAARLAAARRMEPTPAGAVVRPRPIRPGISVEPPAEVEDVVGPGRRRRHLVAGGAIASGVSLALPLAGAAIVVWRRSRSSGGLL